MKILRSNAVIDPTGPVMKVTCGSKVDVEVADFLSLLQTLCSKEHITEMLAVRKSFKLDFFVQCPTDRRRAL